MRIPNYHCRLIAFPQRQGLIVVSFTFLDEMSSMVLSLVAFLIAVIMSFNAAKKIARVDRRSWRKIEMPKKSYYPGLHPPTDIDTWKLAIEDAVQGRQVLLNSVLKQIRSPTDIIYSAPYGSQYAHEIADNFVAHQIRLFKTIQPDVRGRAPIIMIGYSDDFRPDGPSRRAIIEYTYYDIISLLSNLEEGKDEIPVPIVGYGLSNPDEGFLSTCWVNRSSTTRCSFVRPDNEKRKHLTNSEQVSLLLDNPNLLMLLVTQDHNITHPKVLAAPLGIVPDTARQIFDNCYQDGIHTTKRILATSISSTIPFFRENIADCVRESLGRHYISRLFDYRNNSQMLPLEDYSQLVFKNYFLINIPGHGNDCYRVWEAILMGTIPVIERGMGFDRTVYKLPVLLVDDFADLTVAMLQQAYIEALYWSHKNVWEYSRMTTSHWKDLMMTVSVDRDLQYMLDKHPMNATDPTFTRPMVPFDCGERGEKCGPGTKRTPKRSCAVKFN